MSLFGSLRKAIPWSDVVAAAPTVVRGAQQLWTKVRHDAPPPEPAPAPPTAPAADSLAALEAVGARVQALEARLAEQSREAQSASGLIATLAEQNARLVEAVEQLRRQARRLAVATGVLAVGVIAALVLAVR